MEAMFCWILREESIPIGSILKIIERHILRVIRPNGKNIRLDLFYRRVLHLVYGD